MFRCEKLPSLDQWRNHREHQNCINCDARRAGGNGRLGRRPLMPVRSARTFGIDGGDTGDEDDPPGAASARLQALGLVHRRGLGIREKVDQRLCRDWLL